MPLAPVRTQSQLGQALRRARKAQGLSQAELGARAGLRAATVSALENGIGAAQVTTLLAVLAALDLELKLQPRGADLPDLESLF